MMMIKVKIIFVHESISALIYDIIQCQLFSLTLLFLPSDWLSLQLCCSIDWKEGWGGAVSSSFGCAWGIYHLVIILTLEPWPSLPNCLHLPLPVSFTSTSVKQSINGLLVGIPFLPEDCRRGKCWSRCKISGFSCHRITGMFGTLIALFLNSK